jgi:hypothetical protein
MGFRFEVEEGAARPLIRGEAFEPVAPVAADGEEAAQAALRQAGQVRLACGGTIC